MIIIKLCLLGSLFAAAATIGLLLSAKYKNRVTSLKEVKKALNIFETKIKFTYEPIPEIFYEIGKQMGSETEKMFTKASQYMKNINAKEAWEQAVRQTNTCMTKEDLEVLKGLGKLLGRTDLEGQVSQIELTKTFLDTQIQKAEKEYDKNAKLCKTMRNGKWTSISHYFVIKERGNDGY